MKFRMDREYLNTIIQTLSNIVSLVRLLYKLFYNIACNLSYVSIQMVNWKLIFDVLKHLFNTFLNSFKNKNIFKQFIMDEG